MIRLVFVECIDELELLSGVADERVVVITTQPALEVQLKKRGIDCRNTLELFGKQGHEHVIHATKDVVDHIRPQLHQLSSGESAHAFERTAVFHLRRLLNYLFSHLWMLHRAVERFQPDQVVRLPFVPFDHVDASLDSNQPLLGNLIELYCEAQGIELKRVPAGKVPVTHRAVGGMGGRLHQLLFWFMLQVYRGLTINKKVLISPTDTYGMPALMESISNRCGDAVPVYLSSRRSSLGEQFIGILKRKSFSFFSLPERVGKEQWEHFSQQWRGCLNRIEHSIVQNRTCYRFVGVDLSRSIVDFVSHGLASEMHRLNGRIRSLHRVWAIRPPNAVLSQHALGVSYALGEISRHHNIPALLISHGSHVPHPNEIAELEWNEHARTLIVTHYPFVAVQTPWAERFLAQQQQLSTPLSTGPLLFAKKSHLQEDRASMRRRVFTSHAQQKILLHAGTPKSWRSFRPWVYETVDEYIHNINQLIVAVEEVAGIHLAIRFRPVEGLTIDGFRALLKKSDCYEIYDKGTFDEHLLAADMLVSYSSTTLEEALQNRIPVLQYDPDGKYWHIPKCADYPHEDGRQGNAAVRCAATYQQLVAVLQEWSNGSEVSMDEAVWAEHILESDDSWLQRMNIL